MPAFAANIPTDLDLLCESCGYTLNGLPSEGNCPECGTPIADSTVNSGRTVTAWESGGSLIYTSLGVTFRPATFYRSLKTRVCTLDTRRAERFAHLHWMIGAVVIALAIVGHYSLTHALSVPPGLTTAPAWLLAALPIAAAFWGIAWGVTALATRLTAWEAAWRGYRLPLPVVRRGLHYHAAHLLPATIALAGAVYGYRTLLALGLLDFADTIVPYLYVLSAVAIGAAIYLFWTYWVAMRNLLFAND